MKSNGVRLAACVAIWLLACSGCERSVPLPPPAQAGSAVAAPGPDAGPVTLLVGPSWLGLWQGGKLQRRVDAVDWNFNAVHLSADGKAIEVAAYPSNDSGRAADAPGVLRYDAHTLEALGRTADAAAGAWRPLPAPLGTDSPDLPVGPSAPAASAVEAGSTLVAVRGEAWLTAASAAAGGTRLQVRDAAGQTVGPAHTIAGAVWRAALSPDGSTVAAFTPGADKRQAWPGMAWAAATGQTLATPGFSVDDGSARENGAPRTLACLLPRGEGAIFTYLGAPADRWSEFLPFAPGAGTAIRLDTPWVMGCISLPVKDRS